CKARPPARQAQSGLGFLFSLALAPSSGMHSLPALHILVWEDRLSTPPSAQSAPQPPRLLDLVRQLARDRFGQDGPAQRHALWARSFILFHNKRHPRELLPGDVRRFLEPVVHTQKDLLRCLEEAHAALSFLSHDVLGQA